jgi:glucose/arabinose dehydrogenase
MRTRHPILSFLAAAIALGCAERAVLPEASGYGPNPALPPPEPTTIPTIEVAKAVGWPAGAAPTAAPGFAVAPFARGLDHPRWLLVLPNGDVLVAESNAPAKDPEGVRAVAMKQVKERAGSAVPSADRITLLRDADGDGSAEERTVFLGGLRSPFGMTLVGDDLYVANTDALVRFPYRAGETAIASAGEKVADLPAGPINHHWTKDVIASRDGRLLYVTVGSNSNVAENGLEAEIDRAAILEIRADTGARRVFASGLRNPNGLAWHPRTGALWVAVNERDEIGNDLVPDYMTSVVDGGFYGWPWSYFGAHVDPRVEPVRQDLIGRAIVPDYALGSHTASLGLVFYAGELLPARYREGAFVGQHGSWNRKPRSGYKVIFVPFAEGKPSGMPEDVLTGFVDAEGNARGRPVGVAVDRRGALLVADDVGNTIWRLTPGN